MVIRVGHASGLSTMIKKYAVRMIN